MRSATAASGSTSGCSRVGPAGHRESLAARRVCLDCGTNYSVDGPPRYDWTCDVCGGDVVQRDDDTEEAVRRRLDLYERETAPVIAWYERQGMRATVDGMGTTDEVTRRLVVVVDARLANRSAEPAS